MASVQALREFISERLNAAAVEIFTVFEQTIVRYEEKIESQHRLLQINWNPQIKLHRAELPQQNACRKEQRFQQETNYTLEREEPEPPQIREEQEEPGVLQFTADQEEPESLQIKEEPEEPGLLQFREEQEELNLSQIEELSDNQEGEWLMWKFESDKFSVPTVTEQSDITEPVEAPNTEQFLSHHSDFHLKKHIDSESTVNAELEESSTFHSDHMENIPVSEKQAEGDSFPCEETCGENVGKKQENLCQNLRRPHHNINTSSGEHRVNEHNTATRNMKKCRACHEKIHVAYKKCPKCKAAQPHKERLLKARKRFEEKEIEWKDKVKMNHNATHVLDSCFLMLDRIAALGHFPILLLGKKKKTTYTTDIITSLKMKLDDGLQASIKSMYARVLQLHFSRFPQPTAGNSREEGRTDHAFVFFEPPFESVLDLNPVPPNGPDVFEAVDEGTGNTEGLADHESIIRDCEMVEETDPERTVVKEAGNDTATRNMKKCRACHEKIHVACKKCPKCKAAQPHKERLLKARKRFEAKEIEWKDKVKMNCNATQVLDSCFIMLDRIAALGHFPVLVLAKKRKTKYIPYVFTSLKMKLDDGLQASIKSMYARVLQLHFSRFPQPTQPPQPTAGKSREEGRTDHGPTEERLVVLDLCPVPPNAPDVFDEGTGDAEGLADHGASAAASLENMQWY
ncbi:uncharacterized protein LOC115397479 isoform X2 [Salarias fasciatus]|uniref:uncharacterized protein LOC115397479 isoform X2 n=1 Tax=Salarias fasciatus TaxID=181472 RepID=UPI0011769593|nr:uncharacterized protein LOC115397479 isoform X2 [Salarias fasciatus]